jgi:hypothetical protein
MEPGVEISDLCRGEGLNPTMYYQWKRTLLGPAERVFEKRVAKPTAHEQRLTQALARAKEVIVEITTENLEPKETFSAYRTTARRRRSFSSRCTPSCSRRSGRAAGRRSGRCRRWGFREGVTTAG